MAARDQSTPPHRLQLHLDFDPYEVPGPRVHGWCSCAHAARRALDELEAVQAWASGSKNPASTLRAKVAVAIADVSALLGHLER